MKKFFALIAAILFASESFASDLPDKIQNWRSVSEKIIPLIASTNNQNLGQCVYKSYSRKKPQGNLEIIMITGSGAGSLYVPEKVNDSQKLFAASSNYKVLNIAQKRAILEKSENLPLVLTVNADKNITLTIETNSLNESELINFAEELFSLWSVTK